MDELVLAVPGDPSTRTGGYVYDARVVAELNARGRKASTLSLPAALPLANARTLDEVFRRLAGAPRDAALVVDGLAYGALPADRVRALGRPVAALVHHPLAMETGVSRASARRLEASERAALAVACAVVATSAATRDVLIARFGVEKTRIRIAEPGVEPTERAARGGAETVILTVATVTPRKNHVALAAALGALTDLRWRWRLAGSLERDPAATARLRSAIAAAGIADRVDLLGDIDPSALRQAFRSADLFALPSRLEGYGMAFAEAFASGLPVVAGEGAPAALAAPESARRLAAPDDVAGIAAALRRWIADPVARAAAADSAWSHAATLPRWSAAAGVFERVMADMARARAA